MWKRFFDAKQWGKGPHSWTLQDHGAQPPINYFSQMDKFMDEKNQHFKSVQIYMNDVECAETNEASIFRFLRFLVFEIWAILYSQFLENFVEEIFAIQKH